MNTSPHSQKLAALRAKTDRQLMEYIAGRVERGLEWANAEEFYCAERALNEASKLLPLAQPFHTSERRRIEGRLEELREVLAFADVRVHTACS